MKKIKKYILFFSLLVISSNAFATNGCYVASTGRLYTTVKSGTQYETSYISIGTGACNFGGGPGTPCTVKSPVNANGFIGNWDIVYCPIDDYVWVLIAGSSLLAFGFIRNKIISFSA